MKAELSVPTFGGVGAVKICHRWPWGQGLLKSERLSRVLGVRPFEEGNKKSVKIKLKKEGRVGRIT